MTLCPQCHKHLLSQASARCNWCGAVIEDEQYQADAQTQREAYYAHTAAHDAQSLAATEALWLGGTAVNTDPFAVLPTPRPVVIVVPQSMPDASTAAAQEETPKPPADEDAQAGERFRHLEI